MKLITLGVLLLAAPLFSQIDPRSTEGSVEWFSLNESAGEVRKMLGAPRMVAPFGDFVSWQFQIGVEDAHEFSHQVVFRGSTLISVTRQWEEEHDVDALFPVAETKYVGVPDADYTIAIRRLGGGRVLLGMGVTGPGAKTTQVVLMRESELGTFYPFAVSSGHDQAVRDSLRNP